MATRRHTASGGTLESTIKGVMSSKGFRVVKYCDWKKRPTAYGDELLLTTVPYDTIYGEKGRTEFLLISAKYKITARIECKWQQGSGSVDEKLPYLYLNCIETMPETHIIIVIDGRGWKAGAIPWLKDAVTKKKYTTAPSTKVIEVFSLSEFMAWANTTFRP
jgi:hypothetical protein